MSIMETIAGWLAARQHHKLKREHTRAAAYQFRILENNLRKAKATRFGRDHNFSGLHTYELFKKFVPVADYEQMRGYFDDMAAGKPDILWPGKPAYLAKTSGTTSGTKYIPITKESMPFHIAGARNALLAYIYEKGHARFLKGKLIFLSGSPALSRTHGILTGRLSGIVNHYVPAYLRRSQMPSDATNRIEDWESKVEKIAEETLHENMTLISGIPPWVQMYFDKLEALGGKKVGALFPDFQLMVQGGVNFEPYRQGIYNSIGREVDIVETYPSSEGFIAYQDNYREQGLALILNGGIFYEFIPVSEFGGADAQRLSIAEVKLNVNYVLVMSTNAGLWGYVIGDTVRFISLNPYRILVTGRLKHFISAFGEHVIAEEVEHAMLSAQKEFGLRVVDFTVAPQVSPPEGGLPYHEWYIELSDNLEEPEELAESIDREMRRQNTYYNDLRAGNVLRRAEVRIMPQGSFIRYMKSQGKLGGQNKLPRLSNDRKIADSLSAYNHS